MIVSNITNVYYLKLMFFNDDFNPAAGLVYFQYFMMV